MAIQADAGVHLSELEPGVPGQAVQRSPRPRVSRDSWTAAGVAAVGGGPQQHDLLTSSVGVPPQQHGQEHHDLLTSSVGVPPQQDGQAQRDLLTSSAGVPTGTQRCHLLQSSVQWSPRLRVSRDSCPITATGVAAGIDDDGPDDPGKKADDDVSENKIDDLISGQIQDDLWQFKEYSRDSASWQAAAQRRHAHRRRTDRLLGVASIDLSGPHEPTPMVGSRVGQKPGHYFLALTINVGQSDGATDRSVQTEPRDGPVSGGEPEEPEKPEEVRSRRRPPLIYASILTTKGEATAAVQQLLARVRDDRGSFPGHASFRLPSDEGQKFCHPN